MKREQMSYRDHLEKHPEQVEDIKEAIKKSKRNINDMNKKMSYSINR